MEAASIYTCVLMPMCLTTTPCFSDYILTDSGMLGLHYEDLEKDAKEFACYALMMGTQCLRKIRGPSVDIGLEKHMRGHKEPQMLPKYNETTTYSTPS